MVLVQMNSDLTQRVSLAILVRDSEHSNQGVAIVLQCLVDLLAKQALTNHGNLHCDFVLCVVML